jgi:putative DNA primase/helicase
MLVSLSGEAKTLWTHLVNTLSEEMEAPGFPARLKGPWAKLEGYLARLALILGMCRIVADDVPERVEQIDMLNASLLLDYFKSHTRRVYAGLYGQDRLALLGEDVAKLLEESGGSWKGQPEEFHRLLVSPHKPSRAKDLNPDLNEIARRSAALVFEVEKESYTKDDGKKSSRRLWTLLLKSAYSAYSAYSEEEGGEEGEDA